jgi:hypothetical protein
MQHTQEQPHRLATQVNKPCICDKIADPTCEPDDDDNDD